MSEPTLREKVDALLRPEAYGEPGGEVSAVETHMSWVFLTGRHAYKLKKPIRYDHQDFRSVAGRHYYCLEELRLNRRLAPDVYLDVVPLARTPAGVLRVEGGGTPVDWLVKMRRLPREAMLDELLARRRAHADHMRAVAQRLAAFHAGLPPSPIAAPAYRVLLARHVDEAERDLCRHRWGLPEPRVRALCDGQRGLLRRLAPALDERVRLGRVVEGHGDLRPEHVDVGPPVAIIDSLEFSAELRIVDAADELGFLALECERAGQGALGQVLLAAYREASGDPLPPALVHLYQSCRAGTRARLAIRHLAQPRYRGSLKWRRRALRYLVLARRHLDRAAR